MSDYTAFKPGFGQSEIAISLNDVLPSPYQPRRRKITRPSVSELMDNILAVGQLQPIIVTPADGSDGKYYVHAGHRRCAALRYLERATVRAIVRQMSPREAHKLALCENLGREDLTAVEQADALDTYAEEYGLSFNAAARELGISDTTRKRLRLIASAPEALHECFSRYGFGAKACEVLVRLERARPGAGVRKAELLGESKTTVKKLQREVDQVTNRGTGSRRQDAVVCEVGANELELRIRLGSLDRDEPMVKRAIEALTKCLGVFGVDASVAVSR